MKRKSQSSGAIRISQEAVRVRLWDEGGKDPDMATPAFRHYMPLLQRVVDRHMGGAKH